MNQLNPGISQGHFWPPTPSPFWTTCTCRTLVVKVCIPHWIDVFMSRNIKSGSRFCFKVLLVPNTRIYEVLQHAPSILCLPLDCDPPLPQGPKNT